MENILNTTSSTVCYKFIDFCNTDISKDYPIISQYKFLSDLGKHYLQKSCYSKAKDYYDRMEYKDIQTRSEKLFEGTISEKAFQYYLQQQNIEYILDTYSDDRADYFDFYLPQQNIKIDLKATTIIGSDLLLDKCQVQRNKKNGITHYALIYIANSVDNNKNKKSLYMNMNFILVGYISASKIEKYKTKKRLMKNDDYRIPYTDLIRFNPHNQFNY